MKVSLNNLTSEPLVKFCVSQGKKKRLWTVACMCTHSAWKWSSVNKQDCVVCSGDLCSFCRRSSHRSFQIQGPEIPDGLRGQGSFILVAAAAYFWYALSVFVSFVFSVCLHSALFHCSAQPLCSYPVSLVSLLFSVDKCNMMLTWFITLTHFKLKGLLSCTRGLLAELLLCGSPVLNI